MGFHDSLSHLSFVQCKQVKFRPKKKIKIKVFHSVVAVGCEGKRAGERERGGGGKGRKA